MGDGRAIGTGVTGILELDFSHLSNVEVRWNSLPDCNDERDLGEDMIYVRVGEHVAVDAGYYHGGVFRVDVIRDDDWENPVESVEPRDVFGVQAEVTRLVNKYSRDQA